MSPVGGPVLWRPRCCVNEPAAGEEEPGLIRRGPETSPGIEKANDCLSITSVDTEQTLRAPARGHEFTVVRTRVPRGGILQSL